MTSKLLKLLGRLFKDPEPPPEDPLAGVEIGLCTYCDRDVRDCPNRQVRWFVLGRDFSEDERVYGFCEEHAKVIARSRAVPDDPREVTLEEMVLASVHDA